MEPVVGLLARLTQLMGTAAVLAACATVVAQGAGVAVLWSHGLLTGDKVLRYAGVIYGMDPREAILAERVARTPYLADRTATIALNADEIRGITLTLRRSREKFVTARDDFASLLDQLEQATEQTSLRELQITLEAVSPKQAKEVLRTMLSTPPADPADNIMKDIVGIVKLLPDNKLRKILAEFKTEEERQLLHRILLEIGELDDRSSQLTGTQP
jgi:hypothetical protein